MAREPLPPTGQPRSSVTDGQTAPIIFFDTCTNSGTLNGVINATVVMVRYLPNHDPNVTDGVVTAHLRCSIAAANDLIDALQRAVRMATQPTTDKIN